MLWGASGFLGQSAWGTLWGTGAWGVCRFDACYFRRVVFSSTHRASSVHKKLIGKRVKVSDWEANALICLANYVSLKNSLNFLELQFPSLPKMRAEEVTFVVFISFILLYQSVFLISKLTLRSKVQNAVVFEYFQGIAFSVYIFSETISWPLTTAAPHL